MAHKLITIGSVSVTTGYCVENMHLSFGISITSTLEFEWYKVTCWHGMEEFWKGLKTIFLEQYF